MKLPEICIPPQLTSVDLLPIVSMSGGKDSTATALALKEAGLEARYVFADTGWEAPETYAHLDLLRERLGPIDVVGHPGGYRAAIREHRGFSPSQGRWCTRVLKLKPLVAYHQWTSDETGRETVCVVGVRAEESERRAQLSPWEMDRDFKTWTWRPILSWTVADVLDIHHRHNIPIHPLYRRGHDRVGCNPCISADTKTSIRLLAEHSPEQIDAIRGLEREVAEMRMTTPGPESPATATFFRGHTIDEAVAWSRTAHGGVRLLMFHPEPEGGCFRWGMCDAPTVDGLP